MAEVVLEEPYIVFAPQTVQWVAATYSYPAVALFIHFLIRPVLVLPKSRGVLRSVSGGWVLGVGEVRNGGGDSLRLPSVGGRINIVRRENRVSPVGGGGGGSGFLTRGRVGCGGLDPFDQTGYPDVTHGVLELFAVDVTLELLGLLLDSCSPIVLDLIVSPTRQILGYLGPPY